MPKAKKTEQDSDHDSGSSEPPTKQVRQDPGVDDESNSKAAPSKLCTESVTAIGENSSTDPVNCSGHITSADAGDNKKDADEPGKYRGDASVQKIASDGGEPEEADRSGDGEKSEDAHAPSHTLEVDVGITEYLSDQRGVSAIIKQRYSDFIVNEISFSGDIIHLTSTDLPPDDTQEMGEVGASVSVDPILSNEVQLQLKELVDSPDPKKTVSIQVGDDKQERQRIHQAIKSAFPILETRTEEQKGQKVITAMHKKSAGRDNRKTHWPASKSKLPYCRFVMYKENKDTMDVISLVAKMLQVKPGLFQYAGTKDRRAKTTQEVTAHKIYPKKLQDLNSFLRNITLGNFRYVDRPLKLGQLAGNRFKIVLRNVLGSDENLEKGLDSLKNIGFINYFGLQRFGTTSVPTHFIGRALLKGNWEEAVDLILRPRPKTTVLCEKFRTAWAETKDAQKTLDATENRHSIERTVLRSLCRMPKNFSGAIQSLPRNTRMMYVHSYQSFIWNMVASRHIKTYGMKPVIGDLVLPPGAESTEEDETEPPKVSPVALDETTVSQHTIHDVLLPLSGHDVTYPSNEVHSWYKALLEEDGFDINNMHRKQKDFSLPGAYRAVVVCPKEMEWQTFQYDDYTVPLILSDLDRLNKEAEPSSVPDGRLKAVTVSFTLPPSSYATMALREVLKADTSPAHQTSLNTT